jgi:hypothetical protein
VNRRTTILRELRSNALLLASAFVLLIAGILAHGQAVEKGTITGLVNDSSGAIVSGARVSLYNMATDIATETTTNNQGLFVSPPLDPGDYDIQIKAEGFKSLHQSVRLEVGQRVSSNVTLPIGNSSETVEVHDSGVALQTESATIENLRTEEAVKDLPLNGRSFAGLVGLGAGAVPAHTQIQNIPYTQQRGDTSFAFNGLRFQENRLLLDGIGDNENHNGLAVVIFPPIDAIQEFSEETTDADARYGRGNGGTVNLVYKSGSNHFHGDVFEFLRNDALNARNYFNPKNSKLLRQNEYGVTFGGPVFFKQANPKTFFFADYNGQRLSQGITNVDSVPNYSVKTINGIIGYDFSNYAAAVKNPSTGKVYSTANGYPLNNFIPLNDTITPTNGAINTSGANVLNFYQKYATPNLGADNASANNFIYVAPKTVETNAFDVKVNRTFSDKDNGFVRYSQSHDHISQPGQLPNPLVGNLISGPAENPAYQSVLSETHVFSPRLINTARVGWSRFFINAKNWDAGLNLPTTLGIPGVEINDDPRSDGLPIFAFSGYTPIGDNGNNPTQIGTNNYQTDDNINLNLGKHSLDIGFEFVRLQYNMFQTGYEHGSATYNGSYSGLPWTDLLFGAPKQGTYAYPITGVVGLRQSDLAFYVQDNYKVNSRLTLNLGVRYENFLGWPWTEVNNKEYNFVPSISTTSLIRVGTHGVPRSGLSGNNFNLAPRVGLAYKVTSKTVFHGGYGLYYSAPNVTNSTGLSANVPVNDYWTFSNSATYGATGANGAAFNYTSNGFQHTRVTSPDALALNTPVYSQDPNAKTPYSIQWHTAVEQEIPFSTVLKFAYVGTRGVHLDDVRDINTNSTGTPLFGVGRQYATLGSISQVETQQKSSYNALQVTAERRARNLGLLASYTYSHTLDEGTGSPGSVLNPYDIRSDYGNSDINIPNRFVASANYELPFKAPRRLKYAVEGWQLNTILNYFDGLPFSVSSSAVTSDGASVRANVTGSGTNPTNRRTLTNWFNTQAFFNPAVGTWGNSGRNILQGPGTKTVDFSFFKNTNIAESKVLQLRAEFFNLFNTPQFNNPNSTVGIYNAATGSWSNGFGTISSAGSEPSFQRTERQIQLAAKITF